MSLVGAVTSASPKNCVILVPVATHIEPDCERSLVELELRGYPVRRVFGFAAIDQGRSQMASDALADGFDELMWIDSDIGFDPDDVAKLGAQGLPMVCGIYPKKGKNALACNLLPGTDRVTFGQGGGSSRSGTPRPVSSSHGAACTRTSRAPASCRRATSGSGAG